MSDLSIALGYSQVGLSAVQALLGMFAVLMAFTALLNAMMPELGLRDMEIWAASFSLFKKKRSIMFSVKSALVLAFLLPLVASFLIVYSTIQPDYFVYSIKRLVWLNRFIVGAVVAALLLMLASSMGAYYEFSGVRAGARARKGYRQKLDS